MLFEEQSTKCPSCKTSLTWKSHIKRWDQGRLVDEFTFRCESCKREYEFKDDKVVEKKRGRDQLAESEAINFLSRRTLDKLYVLIFPDGSLCVPSGKRYDFLGKFLDIDDLEAVLARSERVVLLL